MKIPKNIVSNIDYQARANGQSVKSCMGFIKFYNPVKKFGFIERHDCGNGVDDIFFHQGDIIDKIKELDPGTHISFTFAKTARGLQARNIKRL